MSKVDEKQMLGVEKNWKNYGFGGTGNSLVKEKKRIMKTGKEQRNSGHELEMEGT